MENNLNQLMEREQVKKWFEDNGDLGWLTLIDILYDNKPDHVQITDVWSKYAGLSVRYDGKDEEFDELISHVNALSQKMCEICGKSGKLSYINGWETTLCDTHFERSDAKNKSRE
jgi:hypothetical protein